MAVTTELSRRVDPLGVARARAVHNLDIVLKKSEEALLREHQTNMLSALRDFFASGERAGYLSEPTGVGKSAVMVSAADAMGLQTVILSPTLQILAQNHREAKKFTPDLDITDYSSRSRDLSGKVLNTTYQSIYSLLQAKESGFDPEKVQLVLCDEAHVGLGLKRHEIYRFFPNALLVGLTATPDFTPLDGYIDRGIVKEDETWTGLFKNNIHEMTLEEAMERDILVGVDVHMIRTNTVVDNLVISSNQEYRQSDLEKYFTAKSRSALAIGMVAGLDELPRGIGISQDQIRDIKSIHDKIKGKRAVIFGISIAHIEELAKELRKAGVSAAAVHGDLDPAERAKILDSHTKGKIQVVLGVDLLRLGWDSPATEVSIHLRPTASGVKKVQELGRVLRPSPETGKEHAIAIELVDEVKKKQQQPVLIAHCFDPEYVLRGSRTGREKETEKKEGRKVKRPKLSFSGINISAVVEQARSQEMLRRRFKQASVEDISNLFDQIISEVLEKSSQLGLRDIFEKAAEALPERIPIEANRIALQAIGSLDANTRRFGKKALLLLNIKTLLTVASNFRENGLISEQEDEDVLASAVLGLEQKIDKIASYIPVAEQINRAVEFGIIDYISQRDGLPKGFLRSSHLSLLINTLNGSFDLDQDISEERIREMVSYLSEKIGLSSKTLERYIKSYIASRRTTVSFGDLDKKDNFQDGNILGLFFAGILKEDMETALEGLTMREKKVLQLRFGLGDGEDRPEPLTYEQIGPWFNVTRERIRQIEVKALRKLRHPSKTVRLKDHIDWGYPGELVKEFSTDILEYTDAQTAEILKDRGIYQITQLFEKSPQELIADDQEKAQAIQKVLSSRLKLLHDASATPNGYTYIEMYSRSLNSNRYWKSLDSWKLLISVTDPVLRGYKAGTIILRGFSQNELHYIEILSRQKGSFDPFTMLDIEREVRKKLFVVVYNALWELVKPPEPSEPAEE